MALVLVDETAINRKVLYKLYADTEGKATIISREI